MVEDIFGLNLEERVSGRKGSDDLIVDEAWNVWTRATNRPEFKVDNRFKKACRDAIANKYSKDRIIRAVSGAAYLRPRERDPMDIRRVIAVLSNINIERQALALLDSGSSQVYTWDSGEPENNLSTIDDIVSLSNTDYELWTGRDHECSGILMSSVDPIKLKEAFHKVSLHLGTDAILPSDVVRLSAIWRGSKKVKVSSNPSRDTYDSGKQEYEILEDIDFGLDLMSERLLISGCPAHIVKEFYLLAPSGYWEEVDSIVTEDFSRSLDDIYKSIQVQYNWHPSQRDEPKW